MTSPEYQSRSVIGFFEATEQLPDGDGLVLFRNRLQLIHKEEVAHEAPVHYEALNHLSDTPRPIDPYRIINSEFRKGIVDKVLYEQGETPQTTYPLMTIINHATGALVSETVNVAKLIKQNVLPIHAASTSKGDEVLGIGIGSLVKIMAERVGVNQREAVVIKDGKVYDVEDAVPRIWRPSPFLDEKELVSGGLGFDPRGAMALSLLQLELSHAFIANDKNRVTQGARGRVEVAYHVGDQPDMQTVLLALIDLIEERHLHLYYTHDRLTNGDQESVFTVVDDTFTELLPLSNDRTLDIALYNACLTASKTFTEI